ncbi:MAG: DUF4426 domain-containing protein [Geminicoccales bacterium]
MNLPARGLPLLGVLALLGSCEPNPAPERRDGGADVLRSTDGSKDFGDYIVYVNAIETDLVTPDVARQYGIVRSKNRAMLTVSIHRKQPDALPTAVRGYISASAVNLTGQLKSLSLREIVEGDAIYYIGEFAIDDGETLMYTIDATPADEASPLSLRFRRQFYVDD